MSLDKLASEIESMAKAEAKNRSITDLLDAQSAARRDDLAAANAVYNFLRDLISAEHAASSFSFLLSTAERDALIDRMKSFFGQNP